MGFIEYVDRKLRGPVILATGLTLLATAKEYTGTPRHRDIFPRIGMYNKTPGSFVYPTATGGQTAKVIPIPTKMKPNQRVTRASLVDTTEYGAF